jgi:putative CocE/NonD family hydrolase
MEYHRMSKLPRVFFTALTAISALSASPAVSAQTPDTLPYAVTRTMVPMRDGVGLNTDVWAPKDRHGSLPFILVRTPYGIDRARYFTGYLKDLADDGYYFVFQDIRGRYNSEGEFSMNRPLHEAENPPGSVDESTDTYDTVEWLLKNVPDNNGRVGVVGISYPGWLAAMAGINPHPAVKAISPQAPMTDTWMGDDFFHYGAFRLAYGFEYSADLELSKDQSVPLPIDRYDTYDWYLSEGPLSNLTALLAGRVPTWTNFAAHPNYDAFWKARALPTYLTKLSVPTLTVGGWWDQEDFYGPIKTYATLEKLDTGHTNYVVFGPWNHGGWSRGKGDKLGRISFGSATGEYFRSKIQAPWFAWWLKDKGTGQFPEAQVFESGSNRWREFATWPPTDQSVPKRLYFRENGGLSFAPPPLPASGAGAAGPFDSYVSDPAHPVPYRLRPVQQVYDDRGSDWYTWLVEDQRFVDRRPDVLTWQTAPLTENVTIAGDITGHLFASTTGSDADWVVKLIDVYPDSIPDDWRMGGYELMVASDILRGHFRRGFEKPEAITPDRVAEYVVDLHQQSYSFQKGHRIMVQVQSTWFPVYDRNPQTFVPNIFLAKPEDFRAQTHRIYRSVKYPSYVGVSVLKE